MRWTKPPRSPAEQHAYRERMRAQCFSWASGKPYHEPTEDECCPDFSCCDLGLMEKDDAKRWEYYHEHYGGKH